MAPKFGEPGSASSYTDEVIAVTTGQRSEGAERVRIERVLAAGRAFLTVTGLVAIYFDPTEPRRLQAITYGVLFGYALYGVLVLYLVYGATQLSQRQVRVMHAVDILWTSVLTFVSEGPVSPFFLFFLFVVLAAAFRWALRETLLTATIVVVVFLTETAVAGMGPWAPPFTTTEGELNRIVLRAAYLLITGVLLSYLADQDKRARADLAAIATVARQPRVAAGLAGSMPALGRHLLQVFGADLVAIVLQDHESGRSTLWLSRATEPTGTERDDASSELDQAQREVWLFPDGDRTWFATVNADGRDAVRAAVPGRWPLERIDMTIPAPLRSMQQPASILTANLRFEDEWSGRIYTFNPSTLRNERAVHLMESMIDHVIPAITNVFLTRRLRQRAGADERARVARELHDGAIQGLFALDMKIEALRRAVDRTPAVVDTTLVELQSSVRLEVQALRDLMQALRPIEIEDSQQLQEIVSTIVERFRRDSGISARFVAAAGRVTLPQAASIEMIRIIQEALVNVRKHSGGQNVLVRIEPAEANQYRLTIEDDGRGFEFEGRLSAAEMDQRRVGPAIIRERARIAGAELSIESQRGRGSRLELVFGGVTP